MRAKWGRAGLLSVMLVSSIACQGGNPGEDAAGGNAGAGAAAPKADGTAASTSAADRAATGRLENGRPVGLFFMTRYWSFTQTLEKAAWYFSPEGKVYQNLEHGFSPEDLAAHTGPAGTFKVAGDQLEVTWSDGKTTKSDLEPDEPGAHTFMWDGGIFNPVTPFRDRSAVVGQYEGGESLLVGGDAAAVSRTLELRADGTFRWDGVGFVSATGERSKISAGAESTTRGTWELSGYSLTMKDDGGKVLRRIVFPYDDEDTPIEPDRMFLGGLMYKKKA